MTTESLPSASPGALRHVGAVLAGILTLVVLDTGIDALMHTSGVFPPYGERMADRLFLLPVSYRAIDSTLGAWVAARLAPDRPMRHALILGAIGVVLNSLATVATLNAGPEFGPTWYPLVLAAIALPCAWVGGRLATRT